MDVFARVCEALREDDLARLRCYVEQQIHGARFSTWLVTVVRHLTIDWFRHRDGRRRLSALAERRPLRRRIFELVFFERRSRVEAYELVRAREAPDLPFGRFLGELRETHKAATAGRRGRVLRELGPPPGRSPPRPSESQGPLRPGIPGTRHAAAKLGAGRPSVGRLVATLPLRSV